MIRKKLAAIPALMMAAAVSTQTAALVITPTAQSFNEYCEAELSEGRKLLSQLESIQAPYTTQSLLQPMNAFQVHVADASSQSSVYLAVHPNAEVRKAAGECDIKLGKLFNEFSLSRPVYNALQQVDLSKAPVDTRRFVELTLRDFQRSGVDKSDEVRQQIKTLREDISRVGQQFATNIREDVRTIKLDSASQLKGLPADYIAAHKPDADGMITLTTAYPDYQPFMRYAESDALRKAYFLEFSNRGYPQNREVLMELAQKRFQLARLLDYKNYAEFVTADKMIGSAGNARDFIEKVSGFARAPMEQDKQEFLKRLTQEQPHADKVYRWQKPYLHDQIQKERFRLDSQEVRQYFAYNKVKGGILDLTQQLFGVTIKKWDTPVWHDSVEAYEIYDGKQLVGRFYLDMFPREGKYQHARLSPIQVGVKDQQVPVATLITNFPSGENLMGHNQVETYLHEFGHLLHYMFSGNHRWAALSGLSTEWDFVEAPSQMLEEWVWDLETLQKFATNSEGKPIPASLVARMKKARSFARGFDTMQQLYYGSLSLNLYDRSPKGLNIDQLANNMQSRYSPYPLVEDSHFYAGFGHLYGYSAIYYTYQWSLAIASDMFTRFKEEGLNNKDVARDYREKVLAPGGSKPAAELVEDFLGRPYNFKAYEEVLTGKG
ncbi:M3 family metallopeptidase [Endozoicomonadaceae bacterium StTr2]